MATPLPVTKPPMLPQPSQPTIMGAPDAPRMSTPIMAPPPAPQAPTTYKANDMVTDASGAKWRRTQGGHWRNTATGQLFSGSGNPVAGGGSSSPGGIPFNPLPGTPGQPTLNLPYYGLPPQIVEPGRQLNNASDVINTGYGLGLAGQVEGNRMANPNVINPFGSSVLTTNPITGQATITQNLNAANQQALGNIQGSAGYASKALQGLLGGGVFGSLTKGAKGAPAPQSNFESAVFNQLTQGLSKQKNLEREQLESSMQARGIPQGSELYSNQMADFNKRYDDILANARSQAVTQGVGSALQGMGTLAGIGQSGFFNPNFQPFQAVPYQQVDVNQLFGTLEQSRIADRELKLKEKMAKMSGGGGGGGNEGGPPPFRVM